LSPEDSYLLLFRLRTGTCVQCWLMKSLITHSLSLSLSLSFRHTHTHTHRHPHTHTHTHTQTQGSNGICSSSGVLAQALLMVMRSEEHTSEPRSHLNLV